MTDTTDKPARVKAKVKPGFVPGGRRKAEVVAERKAKAKEKPKKPKAAAPTIKSKENKDLGLNESAKKLVHYMVWEGLRRIDAIRKLGKSESYGYQLLSSPTVLAHYRAELEVLRTSGAARTIHRLEAIADQDDNLTAAVQASKVLMGVGSGNQAPGVAVAVQITPGYVIDVSAALASKAGQQLTQHTPPTIEVQTNQPLIGNRATAEAAHGAIPAPKPMPQPVRIRRLGNPAAGSSPPDDPG